MTRATLLHVLDQPTALGPTEVRELEQLAQAFPYCQTAHLLLAKAAHDQGTMLAGQRLRRAATYAADRTLLRRLIEQVELASPTLLEPPVVEVEAPIVEVPVEIPVPEPVIPVAAVTPEPSYLPVVSSQPEPVAQAPIVAEVAPAPLPVLVPASVFSVESAPQLEPVVESMPEPEQPETVAAPEAIAEPGFVAPETVATETTADFTAPAAAQPEEEPKAQPEREDIPAVAAEPHVISEQTEPAIVPLIPHVDPIIEVLPPSEPEIEPDLPPQAPAIRPPVEVGDARFEFGLAEPPAPTAPAYELPGLVDEWAASAVTRSLGTPESLPELFAAPAATPVEPTLTPAAFTGDETLGYGYGESSRLGLSLQLLNLLTDKAETDSTLIQVEVAVQPMATPLPPTGTFFEPDPLLLEHWQQHAPPPVLLPSSLDLINNFLRRQPRLTRPAMLPPSPASQTDLSVRSTRVEPDLVSESLARILVRQGKTARAIEIYEKLMVKQPEKMAYFAAQIQQLQPPA